MAPAEARKKAVKKAGKLPKPMVQLGCAPTEEQLKTTNGDLLKLTEYWGTNLNQEQADWIFQLFHDNMFAMYKMSQWGYDPQSKKTELFSTTSRFILVETETSGPIGFVHYRFVLDHEIPAIYCYELQVAESHQQTGIGSLLVRILENMGKKSGMLKVLATVFAYNAKSLGFFHKNGYVDDDTCPAEEQGLDYLILSKKID